MDLHSVLDRLGISSGDTLMIHTAARDLLRHNQVDPKTVLDTLIDHLGPEGTLMVPTINFDWCDGAPFDYLKTPSQMGVITETARLDPRFTRTEHAIYSYAVMGKHTEQIIRYPHPSSYGIGSPFHHLHQLDGKILVIGMPWTHAITFFHYVEEMNKVPYRYYKSFPGDYTSADGVTDSREYFIYVRNLDLGVVTDVRHVEPDFVERSIARRVDELGTYFTSVRAVSFYDEVTANLKQNPGYLHRIEPQGH